MQTSIIIFIELVRGKKSLHWAAYNTVLMLLSTCSNPKPLKESINVLKLVFIRGVFFIRDKKIKVAIKENGNSNEKLLNFRKKKTQMRVGIGNLVGEKLSDMNKSLSLN